MLGRTLQGICFSLVCHFPSLDGEQPKNTEVKNNNILNKDTDDYLTYLSIILERIHKSFYETLDGVKEKGGQAKKDTEITRYCSFGTLNPDVRVIAPELRRQTLTGCNLVFTGVIPTNIPLEKSRPWRTAIGLGARVTNDILEQKNPNDVDLFTTHVVAARHGTQKAYKASKNATKIKLVNPHWLWSASERWNWPDESVFPVPSYDGGKSNSPSNSRQGTPQHNPFEGSSSSGKSRKVSPLAQDGFELPGGYDPESCLETVNPLGSFSKKELEDMDKEVEDLMHSENEESSDEETVRSLGHTPSLNGSEKGLSSKSAQGKKRKSTGRTPSKKKLKMVKEVKNGDDQKVESSSSEDEGSSSSDSSDSGDGNENDGKDKNSSDSSSSSSDSDSSGDGSDSDEDDKLGSLLERRISESQTD